MKKVLLLIVAVAFGISTMYSQVNRNWVLLEIGTGTWCGYCPGAAMGADDLIAAGDPVAVIENHNGDAFAHTDSDARNSYYSISGYPTAQFDGSYDQVVGGSATQSMYSTYEPIVSTRITQQTDYTVEIYGDNVGDNYDILVRITQVGSSGGSDMKVRFCLTESEIAYNWQNQSELNFVNRLMAPNAAGTSVTLTGPGSVVDVPLTFTFNNSWNNAHCELVAFIQDDAGKENHHCEKVSLLNLQPLVAEASFSASGDTICQGSTVNYTDLSSGDILTWNWTFEGGTPATSTDQNPSVLYSSTGIFDVTLIVADANTSDTLTTEDLIESIIEPAQPTTPTGETTACNGSTIEYTTQVVPYAESYTWEVNPTDAGSFIGSSIVGTFVADDSWTGDYTISVYATNNCGVGLSSNDLSCTLYYAPQPYQVSNGGGYCEGDPGYEVTLDGSEIDVDYELFLDDVSTGTILAGTGGALSFGFQTDEGIYNVVGFTSTCETDMYGGSYIYLLGMPGDPTTPTGPDLVCSTESSDYTTEDIEEATEILWILTPAEAGEVTSSGTSATIDWAADFGGLATLSVQGSNDCGLGAESDALEITVDVAPAPVTVGPDEVCKNHQEIYSTEATTGNIYTWEVVGGDIVDGTGTHEITVLWTTVGAGSVLVTESTADGCMGVAEILNITIDDCSAIEDQFISGLILYPNPVGSQLTLSFNAQQSMYYEVDIYNQMGQVVLHKESNAVTGQQSKQFDVSDLAEGLYIISVRTKNAELWRGKIEVNR